MKIHLTNQQLMIAAILLLIGISATTLAGCGLSSWNQKKSKTYEKNTLTSPTPNNKATQNSDMEQSCDVEQYHMSLSLTTEKKRHFQPMLSGTVKMSIINHSRETLDRLYFRNYAASILNQSTKKETTKIFDCQINNEPIDLVEEEDTSVLYVNLNNQKLQPQKRLQIQMKFQTDIPKANDRFGYHKDGENLTFHLTFCFPTLAVYENGNWLTHPYISFGESNYSKPTNFDVTIQIPDNYLVIASGEEQKVQNRKINEYHILADDIRELAMVVTNEMEKQTVTVDNITLNCYSPVWNGMETYKTLSLQSAKDALTLYSKYFGHYIYKELDVIDTYIGSGMEYPGLILCGLPDLSPHEIKTSIDKNSSMTEHCLNVAHETAHQWFYAAVGNDPYLEPWLDEGMAEYCEDFLYGRSNVNSIRQAIKYDKKHSNLSSGSSHTMSDKEYYRYIEQIIPQTMNGKKINQSIKEYQAIGTDEYQNSVYTGGELFLYELRKAIGDKTFFTMMKDYVQRWQLKTATTKDFLSILAKYDDSNTTKKIIKRYMKGE